MIIISQGEFIKYFNPKVVEITEYSREELETTPFIEFIYPEDRPIVIKEYQERISGNKKLSNYEIRILTKTGKLKWLTVNSTLITWEGKPASLTLQTDITVHKKAERELEKSYMEMENRITERTQELSNALENLKKMQEELILNEKLTAIGQLVAGVAHEMNTPLGVIKSSSINIDQSLNESLAELPNLFLLLSKNLQKDFITIFDYSLKNQILISTQEHRKKRQLLIEKLIDGQIPNAEMMADTLADINFPNDISDYYDLFRDKNIDLIIKILYNLVRLKHNTSNIKSSVEKAARIVSALKVYSLQDEDASKSEISIADNIKNTLRLFKYHIAQNIELVLNFKFNPKIDGYKNDLEHVWINLITNALYAMNKEGGVLSITTEKYKKVDKNVFIDKSKKFVLISISDTGSGIPNEYSDKIFNPFFTTKPTGEGSGIGLDLCKTIISRHEGYITFKSKSGKTTFFVWIPYVS